MVDYGLRVSQNGKDVKTCADKECVVTSKYANLKGVTDGGGSKVIPHDSVTTVTIAHGLSYVPFVTMFVDEARTGDYTTTPIFKYTLVGDQSTYWCKADSTNIYLKFWQGNTTSSSITVDYKYFIYLDKGKL